MLTTRPSLIERLQSGTDEGSWEQFVAIYGPLVERLGRRHGLNPEAVDSLVQDFLVRAFTALPRFQYEPRKGRFRDWVLTVALNELRQNERARAAYLGVLERLSSACEQERDPDEELEIWWQTEERRRILEIAIERLEAEVPAAHLGVFRLSALDGRPVHEVAAFYRIRGNHVSVIKCRILQRLRALVSEIQECLE